MTVIEVFADVCCPFTHVGLRRLVEHRRARGRDEPRLLVRAWPLELVNGVPLDRDLIADEVQALRAQVAPELFRGFEPDAFPDSSLPAFALAAVSYAQDLATGEAVSLDLRDALFEQGRDIGDPAVLRDIGSEHGVRAPTADMAEWYLSDWHEGEARGVVGSPHFFVEGWDAFCPVLDIKRVDGELQMRVDERAMDEFFVRALQA